MEVRHRGAQALVRAAAHLGVADTGVVGALLARAYHVGVGARAHVVVALRLAHAEPLGLRALAELGVHLEQPVQRPLRHAPVRAHVEARLGELEEVGREAGVASRVVQPQQRARRWLDVALDVVDEDLVAVGLARCLVAELAAHLHALAEEGAGGGLLAHVAWWDLAGPGLVALERVVQHLECAEVGAVAGLDACREVDLVGLAQWRRLDQHLREEEEALAAVRGDEWTHEPLLQLAHDLARLVGLRLVQLELVRVGPRQQEQGDVLPRQEVRPHELARVEGVAGQPLVVRRPHLRLHRAAELLDEPVQLVAEPVQEPAEQRPVRRGGQLDEPGAQDDGDPHRLAEPVQCLPAEAGHALLQALDAPQHRGHDEHVGDLVEESGQPQLQVQLQPEEERRAAVLGELAVQLEVAQLAALRVAHRLAAQAAARSGDRLLGRREAHALLQHLLLLHRALQLEELVGVEAEVGEHARAAPQRHLEPPWGRMLERFGAVAPHRPSLEDEAVGAEPGGVELAL
ncbi:hypothetical protein [Mumia zhuanghuii]|uniref:Uncharacterized protein n=1 Tax=Mumia zhuanghuii TaxID=2585211 RepID=A0A5C4MB64_9ACTN|nr:hypothetical protein [Mumia zhuanghuii]TNC33518.1 hypothetical protein FHE65_28935 [Mumia zhuanghuii]